MDDSRSKTGKVVRWTVGVAIVALVVATVAGWLTAAYRTVSIAPAGSLEVKEARSFTPDGIEKVTIKGVSEAIRLTESTNREFEVRLTGRAATSNPDAVPKLVAEKNADTLRIVVDHRPEISFGPHGAELMLEVAVPAGYAGHLSVESVSGAIHAVPHRYAAFNARTTSGSIGLESLRSTSFTAHSVSGAVTAQGLEAQSAELNTTSGRIALSGALPSMRIRSVSGAVTAESISTPSRVEVSSTSGRVSLSLPKSSQFTLDARSTSGAIECAFPILVNGSISRGRHELVGVVGTSGGGEVKVATTSGAIAILKK